MATYPGHAEARGPTPVTQNPPASRARHDQAAARTFDREILLLAIVVILGIAMTVLDLTIVNVAIPTLGRDLGTSIATIQWVITGYMLAFAGVIPLSGWATARLGARQVWIASLATFMLGSVLAGLAWSAGAPRTTTAVPGRRRDPGGTVQGERPATNLEG